MSVRGQEVGEDKAVGVWSDRHFRLLFRPSWALMGRRQNGVRSRFVSHGLASAAPSRRDLCRRITAPAVASPGSGIDPGGVAWEGHGAGRAGRRCVISGRSGRGTRDVSAVMTANDLVKTDCDFKRSTVDVKMDLESILGRLVRLKSGVPKIQQVAVLQGFPLGERGGIFEPLDPMIKSARRADHSIRIRWRS